MRTLGRTPRAPARGDREGPLEAFIRSLPKAELHVHLEGTLEPDLMFELARRNGVGLRFASVDELRDAYRFEDLQSFLDLYYEGARVLRTERDFFDLTWAYLRRARHDGVRHAEVFFDPQTHTGRGVPLATALDGIEAALRAGGASFGISSGLIACFVRDLGVGPAWATLDQLLPFRHRLAGVGLDSAERGHPPAAFAAVFARARAAGLHVVAHAGEEGPAEYVRQALDVLRVERIDHGVRAIDDPALVARLARDRVPLTVCPLSNQKLGVCDDLARHPLGELLAAGVVVTVNSDDPAYFGGYVHANYLAVRRALDLSRDDLRRLAANSLRAAFLPDARRRALLAELDACAAAH